VAVVLASDMASCFQIVSMVTAHSPPARTEHLNRVGPIYGIYFPVNQLSCVTLSVTCSSSKVTGYTAERPGFPPVQKHGLFTTGADQPRLTWSTPFYTAIDTMRCVRSNIVVEGSVPGMAIGTFSSPPLGSE
jgi:hypothetical protein